ncbi:uncharacterized protein [Chiloscyllium punctatum]
MIYKLKRNLFCWLILCLLLQGMESFIIKSSDDQCLETSLESDRVMMDSCNPDSQLQDWAWKQKRFINQGTRRCLSADQSLLVQTVACENVANLTWTCRKHRLIHTATSMFLIAEGNVVSISEERKKNSKWNSMNNIGICQMLLKRNPETTSAKTQMLLAQFEEALDGVISDGRQNDTQVEETTTEKHQPYPIEDSTNWNYAMLALAFITLFLGFLILVLCSRANKKKKMKEVNELKNRSAAESEALQKTTTRYADEIDDPAETDQMLRAKQAYISFEQVPKSSSPKISSKPGEIMIEWKDGNISSLFMDAKEDDI